MTLVEDDHPLVLRCLQEIERAVPVGPQRRETWERCWEASATTPPYFDSNVIRWNQRFYDAPGYELEFLSTLRRDLYGKYLAGVEHLSEFGCGNGQNLVQLFGKMRLKGYDWAQSAVERVAALGIKSERFDMFSRATLLIPGAALTVHAMEQLGTHWLTFLEVLMRARPQVVIHIEPVEEFYDRDNLLDWLALAYHRKRGYLSGYQTHLQRLAQQGTIEILQSGRNYVGSLFHEAYSVLVWRPI